MAQHRTHNGVTLEQIAEATKISMRFLRAIESEDYSKLPGGIYARSYLRQYAAAIGFDEDELLTRYDRATGTIGDQDASTPRKPAGSDSGRKRTGLGLLRLLGSIRIL